MRWKAISKPEQKLVQQLQKELGVSAIIATLLAQRGMHTFDAAKAFFRPQWEDLHSPFLMQDERLNTWASLYKEALKNANLSSQKGSITSSPMQMSATGIV